MDQLGFSPSAQRRARTRHLIQLGGLLEKAGLAETFGISLGADLQKDPSMKMPMAALFKALLDLNDLAQSKQGNFTLWAQQGLEALGSLNERS